MSATLDQIRDLDAGAAYPGWLLEGCETALILFAAGFMGKQDAYWIAEAGLGGTCVDNDLRRLQEMQAVYPADWFYYHDDAFGFATRAVADRVTWDVVSLDPWTQDFQRCADNLASWCALARKAVILGTGVGTRVVAPDGWRVSEVRQRSDYDGGVFWTCLERA